MNDLEIIEMFNDKQFKLIERYNKKGKSIKKISKRFQDAVVSFMLIFKEKIQSFQNELLQSKMLNNTLLEKRFVEQIKKRVELKLFFNTFKTNPNNQPVSMTKEFILKIKPNVMAKQLIIFDQSSLKNVWFSEFYSDKNLKTLQTYINHVKIVESFALDTMKEYDNKKVFTFFIKTAKECIELGDYNMAFFLYSSILGFSMMKIKSWNDLKHSTKSKWNDLTEIFKLSNNYRNYQDHFEKHNLPKIPIASVWLGDIIRIKKLNTILIALLNARDCSFNLTKNNDIQMFLNSYIPNK